ncbi:11592_t:CDS:10 [Ambispora gerdemannii]|uniref:11592_t:CDS:1 n=1 Tax=Ambispora gerdemannii TaxID=144530 RepID=A0A9N8VPV0_9GLOM|nr:11592_t:CDS:10 [Ambispora gerdemannii]
MFLGVIRFRQQLQVHKNKETPAHGNDNDNKKLSVIQEYLQRSPDCEEIFGIWDMQQTHNITRLQIAIPDLLAKILDFANSNTTSITKATGTLITRNIITRNYMKTIHQNLTSGNLPLYQATLRLLIAMNSCGASTTREVYQNFNFGMKALGKLFNTRRKQSTDENVKSPKTDVRTLYIYFILSFFKYGDSKLKQEILGIKNFVSGLFPGLMHDSYEFIDEVLTTLYNHVIIDNEINRTAKVGFFNNWILDQNRNNVQGSDRGINEKNFRVYNIILLRFIVNLNPTNDLRQQELLLKILKVCPELVYPFWKSIHFSFEPRLSYKWLFNMTLAQKIISLSVPEQQTTSIPKHHYYNHPPDHPPPMHIIMENILPNVINRFTLSKCIQHQSPFIKYKTMIVLAAAFLKFGTVVRWFRGVSKSFAEVGASTVILSKWNKSLQDIHEEMKRRVPDLKVILSLHSSILADAKQIMSLPSSSASITTSTPLIEDDEPLQESKVRNDLLYESVLRIIKYYQTYIPESTISDAKFDVGRFIPADFFETNMQLLLQKHLLEILLVVDDFKWRNRPSESSPTHIYTLLDLYLSSTPYHQIQELAERVLERHLADSIVFNYESGDLRIWLDSLKQGVFGAAVNDMDCDKINSSNDNVNNSKNNRKELLSFLESCILRCLQSPYRYIDDARKLMSDALRKKSEREDMDMDIVDNEIDKENSSRLNDIGYSIISPLLLTVIEQFQYINKDTTRSVVVAFFISNLLKNFHEKRHQKIILANIFFECANRLHATVSDNGDDEDNDNSKTTAPKKTIFPSAKEQLRDLVAYFENSMKFHKKKKSLDISADEINSLKNSFENVNLEQLLEIWKSHQPLSQELEIAFLQKLDEYMVPGFGVVAVTVDEQSHNDYYVTDHNNISGSSRNNIFESAEKRLFNILPSKIADEIVTCIITTINEITQTRAIIFGNLVRAHPSVRHRFVDWILSLQNNDDHETRYFNHDNDNDNGFLENLVIVIEAFLDSVLVKTKNNSDENRIIWAQFTTNRDKQAVSVLIDKYSQKIFEKIDVSLTRESPSIFARVLCNMLWLGSSSSFAQTYNRLNDGVKKIMFENPKEIDRYFGLDFLCVVKCCLVNFKKENNDRESEYEDQAKHYKIFISVCLHHATLLLEKNAMKNVPYEAVTALFSHIDGLINLLVPKAAILDANIVGEFIFVLLEKKFEDAMIIQCVKSLIMCAYSKGQVLGPPLAKILESILNNPQFQILARPPDLSSKSSLTTSQKSPTYTIRLSICCLLHAIFRISRSNNQFFSPSFLNQIISIYGASTSPADQLLLEILVTFEKVTRGSIASHVLCWGPAGSVFSNTSGGNNSNRNLMGPNIVIESLGLIEPAVMLHSYTRFPMNKNLEVFIDDKVNDIITNSYKYDKAKENTEHSYDPSFFLPLFANLIASYGTLIDCRKFIEINALGFVVVASSSSSESMRRATYYIMDEFYVLLEHTEFREKRQILLLLDSLKNSITERKNEGKQLQRIPTIITVFVAHALSALLNPAHFMYPIINKFLLQRPILDLEDIPLFYSLFYSSTENYQKERVWILRLLSAGLRSVEDYKLFKRRHVWDIISAYYNSQLADNVTRKLVIEILFNAASIPQVITEMITKNGLLSWLHYLCCFGGGDSSTTTLLGPENDFSLVAPRLLLRVLQGSRLQQLQKKLRLHLHNRDDFTFWIVDQAVCVATGLIQLLESVPTITTTEFSSSIYWSLNLLDTLVSIFHYLTLVSSSKAAGKIFLPYHASFIFAFLKRCEKDLVFVNNNSNNFMIDNTRQEFIIQTKRTLSSLSNTSFASSSASFSSYKSLSSYSSPQITDSLESLYMLDTDVSTVYQRIIRKLFEMVVMSNHSISGNGNHEKEVFAGITARALLFGVCDEAKDWVRECLNSL